MGNIRYNVTPGTNVQIKASDIARFYNATYSGDTLQYVLLTGVPATGSLYYNYYNTSSFGVASRAQVTSRNCSGQVFYANPTSTGQYALTELTYVPYGSTAKGWFAKSLTGDPSERAKRSFDNEANCALRDVLVKKAETEGVPVQTALLRYMAEYGTNIGLQIVPITSCSKLEQLEDVAKFL